MATFWFFAALLVVVALAFVLPPLLRSRNETIDAGEQKELTVQVYRDQFNELDNDLKIGTISQDQYDTAKQDIERNLLEDMKLIEEREQEKLEGNAKAGRIVAGIIAIFVPLAGFSLYAQWGAGEAGLDPASATPEVATSEHNAQSVEQLVAQLQERLQAQPDDGEGWYMLARTYLFLKRYDEAVQAFRQALSLGGDQSPEVLATYADAIALASGRRITDEAVEVLNQALHLDPFHVKSLWLMGTAYYQKEDYKGALKYWERLLQSMEPGTDDYKQMLTNVNELRKQTGQSALEAAQPVAAGGDSISGTVRLGDSVADKASPEDTVFVFARAVQGPRMPLAIVRKQVKDLPFEFTLNDAMAMNPNMKLSTFSQVVVGARISKTGNAMPQSGDLEGFSGEVNVGSEDAVQLVIDSVVN